ncbi:uncharacterized protein DS421_11g336660 [Arachis hypogaea]|nr:uncharacterized protein DS421_11g336660 [Arachis hypogaea]
MLQCDHYMPSDRYNLIVEGYLRDTGFYHVSQIGVVQYQSALINALIERWRPETHTFHFPVGECAVTLEDVALILGLLTNGLPVTGPTLNSYETLEGECLDQFGVAPRKADLFVWEAYAIGRIDPDVIPLDIRQHSAIWSATVLLISFECIEWHASDRLRRQFGLTQGVPHQERDLGEAHGEVLTGLKNQDWSGTHSFWVMHWTNRYSHVLVEHMVLSQH